MRHLLNVIPIIYLFSVNWGPMVPYRMQKPCESRHPPPHGTTGGTGEHETIYVFRKKKKISVLLEDGKEEEE